MVHTQTWWGIVSLTLTLSAPSDQVDPCSDMYRALDAMAHVRLTLRGGPIESMWSGELPADCEVAFETNDSTLAGAVVPDFRAEPDSEMYRAGWRTIPEIGADGAGSGVHGVQRGDTRCVIQWEQPAYIDDDGTFVQSDTFTMLIQCSEGGGP